MWKSLGSEQTKMPRFLNVVSMNGLTEVITLTSTLATVVVTVAVRRNAYALNALVFRAARQPYGKVVAD